MDLIKKYSKLAEAKTVWPGTPEYKKRFDPSFNPYDPEGKVKKALKLAPYGSREKQSSDEDEKPASQPATKGRGRPKKMSEAMSAYGRIDARFKKLSGRSMGDAAKEHEAEAKKLQKEIEAQQKEIDRRKAAMRKEEVEQTTPVYNQHIKGMSTYKDIVKKHGRSKTNQIISQLTQERNSLRKHSSDWAGPAHLKKHDMAIQGLTKAVKEEREDLDVEQISELSKSTLGSYITKAATNSKVRSIVATDMENKAERAKKQYKKDSFLDVARKFKRKSWKRDSGIEKAVSRLTKEEAEQIDEESLTAGKRLISKHGEGTHTARVYKDTEYNEYQVHHYKDGKHMGEGPVSYHDDKEDAQSTAEHSLKKRMGEEVEQIDELSTNTLKSYHTKAYSDMKTKGEKLGMRSGTKADWKRIHGMETAKSKMYSKGVDPFKEETNIVSKYLSYTVEQSNNDEPPFKPSPKKQIALPGKYGASYSTARHLARMGLKAAIKDLKKGPEAGKKQIS